MKIRTPNTTMPLDVGSHINVLPPARGARGAHHNELVAQKRNAAARPTTRTAWICWEPMVAERLHRFARPRPAAIVFTASRQERELVAAFFRESGRASTPKGESQ